MAIGKGTGKKQRCRKPDVFPCKTRCVPRYNRASGKEQRCRNVAEGSPATYLQWVQSQEKRKEIINNRRREKGITTLIESDAAGYLVNPGKNKKGKLPETYRRLAEEAKQIGAKSKDPKIKELASKTSDQAELVAKQAEARETAPTQSESLSRVNGMFDKARQIAKESLEKHQPIPDSAPAVGSPTPKRRGRKPKPTEPAYEQLKQNVDQLKRENDELRQESETLQKSSAKAKEFDEVGFWLLDNNFDRSRFADFNIPPDATKKESAAKKFYKQMAEKYHPDKGGTEMQMANLTKLRDQLMVLVEMNEGLGR